VLATYDAIMFRFVLFVVRVHATMLIGLLGILVGSQRGRRGSRAPLFHPLPPTSRNTNGRSSRRKTGHFHAVKSRDRGDIQLSLSKLKTLEGRPDDEVRANAIDPLAARDDGATMLRLTPFHRCLIHSLRATVAEARAVQNCAQGQTVASHRFWPKLVPKKTSLPKFWDIVLPK